MEYEADTFEYTRPSHYTPDWKLREGLYIESKGYFAPADRKNLLAFRTQYPKIEILLLFANSDNKLHRNAKMTYAEWCIAHKFRFADFRLGIPREWIKQIRDGT